MPITITKLGNGNVEVTGTPQDQTYLPTMNVFRDKSVIDGVKVVSDGGIMAVWAAADVAAVISPGGGTVNTPAGDILYTELKTNFFNA